MSIIEINDLVKKYKKKKDTSNEYKLSIKNLVIERGKIFGLLGPNGSGKSTLIKLVLDLIFPDAGLITIFGISNKLKESRNFVGYLP
ncbi:MAG: ABC transporter, partial [Ignavibacteria bacterium CG08_land_8_20_14_0_20_37_9]